MASSGQRPASTATDARFVGFKALSNRADSQPTSLACLSSETRSTTLADFTIVGNCCPTSGTCAFPTTCLAGTLYYEGSTRVCGTSSDCARFTVLPTSASITQVPTVDWFCYDTLTPWPYPTMYLTDPALQAAVTKSDVGPTDQSSVTGGDNALSTSPSFGGVTSKAWIAGAVIGPLVLIGFIIAGVLILLARRRRRRPAVQQPPSEAYFAGKPELEGSGQSGSATTYSTHGGEVMQPKPELMGYQVTQTPVSPSVSDLSPIAPSVAELNGLGHYSASAPRSGHELSGTSSPAELTGQRPPAELTGLRAPAELSGQRPPGELAGYGAGTGASQPHLQGGLQATQPNRRPAYELDTR